MCKQFATFDGISDNLFSGIGIFFWCFSPLISRAPSRTLHHISSSYNSQQTPSIHGLIWAEITLNYSRKLYSTAIFINLLHRNRRYSLFGHGILMHRKFALIVGTVERQFACALSHQIWLVKRMSAESLVLASFKVSPTFHLTSHVGGLASATASSRYSNSHVTATTCWRPDCCDCELSVLKQSRDCHNRNFKLFVYSLRMLICCVFYSCIAAFYSLFSFWDIKWK